MNLLRFCSVAFVAATLPCLMSQAVAPIPFQIYEVEIISARPHDPRAFTQGLLFHEDYLYESTGLHGASSLRKVDPMTGKVALQVNLPQEYFGEGLTRIDNELYQLTWKNEKAIVYNLEDFTKLREIPYEGEGWGLEYDGAYLLMTDGSDKITFRDPETFDVIETISVTIAGQPLAKINELEYVNGLIYANVWQTKNIIMIHPRTGRVTGVVQTKNLLTPEEESRVDVLNGIAYDEGRDVFYITGKLWPTLFEVRFKRQ